MLHQAGFTNSVATLGTALTKEHLPLLSRGEPSIILSYDGDEAGIQAAIKASRLLSAQGAGGGCVVFSDGEDPADLIFNKEVEKVRALFSKPIPFVEFYIDESIKNYNLKDPVEKQRAFEELVQFLNELPSAIAHSYRGILANKLNLDGSMIKLTNRGFTRSKNAFVNEDILELTILKSVLNEPNFLDLVLDVVDPSMFKTHMIEFDKIVKGDLNSPQIRRLMLWEDIKIYNEEELIAALISFMNTHYLSVLERVKKDSTLSFEKKSFLIRKIQHTIFKLKKGELVPYESFSSF
jgi:DNA primase